MSSDLVQLVERFWREVWGEGRYELLPELFTDPWTRHAKRGTQVRSLEEFRADLVQYRRVIGSPHASFRDQAVSGDRIWTRLSVQGVDADTGEARTFAWIQIHRIEGGRIAEAWELYEPGLSWPED